MWRRFRLLMVKFGQLLISTSGHTDKDRNIGYKNLTADVEELSIEIEHVRWIKSTNYKIKI